MFVLLFLLWIVFNGQFTVEIAVIGLLITGLVFSFMCRFMGYRPGNDIFFAKESVKLIRYLFVLIWEILKANIATIAKTLRFGREAEPAIVTFDVPLKTELGRVLLANSITLTPGTITVALQGNHYTVHCLDKRFGEGLDSCVFVRLIADMERDYQKHTEKRAPKDVKGREKNE